MQYSTLVLAAVAVVGTNAVLNLTDVTFGGITVGTPFEVTWGDASGSVALILKSGDPNHLDTVSTITAGLPAPSGSFSWTPDADLVAGNYALEIQDAVTTNYGALFQLLGATASPSASASASASATTTATLTSSVTAATTTSSVTATSTGSSFSGSSSASTTGSVTSSKSSSSTSSSASTASTSAPPSTNSAASVSSSFALILLGCAAFALN